MATSDSILDPFLVFVVLWFRVSTVDSKGA